MLYKLQSGPKSGTRVPLYYFCDNFCKCTPILFLTLFTVRTRNLWQNVTLRLPPHLYSVTALPSKTYTTANTDATFSNV